MKIVRKQSDTTLKTPNNTTPHPAHPASPITTTTSVSKPTLDSLLRHHRDILISAVEEKANRQPSTSEIWDMTREFVEKYPTLCEQLKNDGVIPVSINQGYFILKTVFSDCFKV